MIVECDRCGAEDDVDYLAVCKIGDEYVCSECLTDEERAADPIVCWHNVPLSRV